MKIKTIVVLVSLSLAAGALVLTAQQANIDIHILGGQDQLKLAVPEFLGSGDAAKLMQVFNDTLWSEIDGGGVVKLVGKSLYPLTVPQRPEDFLPLLAGGKSAGPWLTDWSNPPVSANDLAFGYAAAQNGQFQLLGNLDNLSQANPAQASLFAKRYVGALDENGARDVARQYAADILAQFGGKDLAGTKIYFVSDRTVAVAGSRRNQGGGERDLVHGLRRFPTSASSPSTESLSSQPALSADGKAVWHSTSYPQNIRQRASGR